MVAARVLSFRVSKPGTGKNQIDILIGFEISSNGFNRNATGGG
ncbi:MAG: hypothetical protein OXD01_14725 [Gammaproteobacteria bacterium]|nr:hypothetical protein [Gammaproteobacteria bacterium]